MEFRFDVRVYYEDTDAMGVVYHANYLRFMERARTELLEQVGPSIVAWTERGLIFPIYHIDITFRAPARLGDALTVITRPQQSSPYRLSFNQRIERIGDSKVLIEAKVDAVCTDLVGQLREFPTINVPKAS
ncbi:MAG: YbgC/FadM family acyl-CoA thioesterase [Polyangiaceae bacterium]|jgi:tol-pal system-associated acyl-CoA thioesterase|nr:YbgC/FadM family acyl-CoA thioesterase [Polyangiaceae bacterium]